MNKTRDVNSKVIFHNPSLCSEFLRDNIDIPILKNVRPEDIEDVSTQYKTYMGTEFEADTVKKVRIKELLDREDVMSFIMMLGKAQDEKDLKELFASYGEKVDLIILQATPEELQIIENIICALLRKVNATKEEIELCVEQVRRRQMGLLFENMQKMDIQAERKNTEEARKQVEEEASRMIVILCQENGRTKQETKNSLVEKRGMSEQKAEEMIECYWKE